MKQATTTENPNEAAYCISFSDYHRRDEMRVYKTGWTFNSQGKRSI